MLQALIFNSSVLFNHRDRNFCMLTRTLLVLWYFLPPRKQPSDKEDFEFIAFCPLRRRNCSSTVAIVLKHMSRIYTIPLSGMKFSHGRRDFLHQRQCNARALEGSWAPWEVSSLTPLFTRINWSASQRCLSRHRQRGVWMGFNWAWLQKLDGWKFRSMFLWLYLRWTMSECYVSLEH